MKLTEAVNFVDKGRCSSALPRRPQLFSSPDVFIHHVAEMLTSPKTAFPQLQHPLIRMLRNSYLSFLVVTAFTTRAWERGFIVTSRELPE